MAIINDDDNGNLIPGTDEADEIYGNGGDDTIQGGAGDTVSGGDGNDVLSGSFISGDAGDDTIIVGDVAPDSVDGGEGTDTLALQASISLFATAVSSIEKIAFDASGDLETLLGSGQF
jgi:Ca2+-binding RTX toxin-like protein